MTLRKAAAMLSRSRRWHTRSQARSHLRALESGLAMRESRNDGATWRQVPPTLLVRHDFHARLAAEMGMESPTTARRSDLDRNGLMTPA